MDDIKIDNETLGEFDNALAKDYRERFNKQNRQTHRAVLNFLKDMEGVDKTTFDLTLDLIRKMSEDIFFLRMPSGL